MFEKKLLMSGSSYSVVLPKRWLRERWAIMGERTITVTIKEEEDSLIIRLVGKDEK